jgi:hypothetical protein
MTPSTIPMLIDNTGLEASETVRFGVDGRTYEIDLPARRAGELRSMADRYIRVARKIRPAPSPAQQSRLPAPRDQEQPRRMRSRARQRGLPTRGSGNRLAVQAEPAATATVAATEAEVRDGGHGLTDGERQELRTIADAAKPRRDIVASRLRNKGLTDRDTAGNWWLTDAGRRELTSA